MKPSRQCRASSRSRRDGLTMIEMMISMTMSSVFIFMGIAWMHQTLKYSSKVNDRQHHHQSLMRISSQLRHDVRQSESIEMDTEKRLIINVDGKTIIEYSIEPNGLTLHKKQNGKLVQQELFFLSSTSAASWDESEMPEHVSLIVSRLPKRLQTTEVADSQASRDAQTRRASSRDPMPIDLMIRVGPNAWQMKTSAQKKTQGASQEGDRP